MLQPELEPCELKDSYPYPLSTGRRFLILLVQFCNQLLLDQAPHFGFLGICSCYFGAWHLLRLQP